MVFIGGKLEEGVYGGRYVEILIVLFFFDF